MRTFAFRESCEFQQFRITESVSEKREKEKLPAKSLQIYFKSWGMEVVDTSSATSRRKVSVPGIDSMEHDISGAVWPGSDDTTPGPVKSKPIRIHRINEVSLNKMRIAPQMELCRRNANTVKFPAVTRHEKEVAPQKCEHGQVSSLQ